MPPFLAACTFIEQVNQRYPHISCIIISGYDNLNKSTILEKIDYYIRQHYMDPINTNQIAEAFNFTPSYFSKVFKKMTGLSPKQYISQLSEESK